MNQLNPETIGVFNRASVKATVPSDLVPQVIRDKKYRIEVNSTFHCLETGIKFEVESKAIIEYSVQYDNDYMNLIQKNGYELLGPMFNVRVESGVVSEVHLPHYVSLDGFRDQSMIKFGHFKNGKIILKTPTRIEPSYIVLEKPTFCYVGAIGKQYTSIWRRKKSYPINGKVLIYFRVVCPGQDDIMEYRIHLYLLPAGIPSLKDLDDLKRYHGFHRVDKPSHTTSSVYTKTNYTISLIGEELNPYICPEFLQFMVHKEIKDHPFTEINISKNAILRSANPISLHVEMEKSSESEPVWKGRLSRDIEELTSQAVQRGTPLGHFMDKYRGPLIQNVRNIKPVLDDLKKEELLKEEHCSNITSQQTPQDQMRELLSFVQFWGREDKNTFYRIVKHHNGPIIKEMERKN
ncbi:NACHT, LRR and PYD domains-containing protein 1b allele 3-like isoform X2 [Eleutherodactylus coqui]|uniref:NACHT, LRR and PYD domains-containing protein 1b allele 3-like isoform X2 n=1 Tax=Eleutherodactylus coqui TaxID=57060 RepID=UPI003462570F